MTETVLIISLVVLVILTILECVFFHTKSSSQEKDERIISRLQTELTVLSLTAFGLIGSIFFLSRVYEDILLLAFSVSLSVIVVVIFMYASEMEKIWKRERESCERVATEQMAEWNRKRS